MTSDQGATRLPITRTSGVTARVLNHLHAHPGPFDIHTLAAATGLDPRQVSDACSGLVRKGHPGMTQLPGRGSYEYHRTRGANVHPLPATAAPKRWPVGTVLEVIGYDDEGRCVVRDEDMIVHRLAGL